MTRETGRPEGQPRRTGARRRTPWSSRPSRQWDVRALVAALALGAFGAPVAAAQAQATAPRVLLDLPVRAVEYQLDRLTADELVQLERRADDRRYRPVYVALLTRRGVVPDVRDEALAALIRMDNASAAEVIVPALARVAGGDDSTAARLIGRVARDSAALLAARRSVFADLAADAGQPPLVVAAAYAALVVADRSLDPAWTDAAARGHLAVLLTAVPHLPWDGSLAVLRDAVFARVTALVEDDDDVAVRAAAVTALAAIRADAAAFTVIAGEIVPGADPGVRAAAVRALGRLPADTWPRDQVPALATRLVAFVRETPPAQRTTPDVLDAIELGHALAGAMPADTGAAVRRDLRDLGIQIVRLGTVLEELRFDVKWFVVEAGRPVQIVLANRDTMPHNVVVGRPGSLEAIGTAAAAMPMPADPSAKPFVPDLPSVIASTGLVGFEETTRLNFIAPRDPGEYVFVCTFPGHWTRMYGVMLVVPDLAAWDARPPVDPMTKGQY